jgi:D-alanyl-D-alanine dipeptidase
MWAILPDARYVANPRTGSRHGRGGAVDLTLVDANGKELEMPTAHDDFTEKARADAPSSEAAASNRATLRAAMEAEGFAIAATEWWHFNAKDSKAWPLVDVPMCEAVKPESRE